SSFVASSSPPLILFNLNLRTQITLATHTYQTQETYLSSQAVMKQITYITIEPGIEEKFNKNVS
ncbi:hypothetical protein HID58_006874, partial [Brassica napus]